MMVLHEYKCKCLLQLLFFSFLILFATTLTKVTAMFKHIFLPIAFTFFIILAYFGALSEAKCIKHHHHHHCSCSGCDKEKHSTASSAHSSVPISFFTNKVSSTSTTTTTTVPSNCSLIECQCCE